VLSTGASAAYTAVNGGTVNVTGADNTLTTTTASALNVANTTIGASGLTFKSISAGEPFPIAFLANGIVLNATGASGGLTVTGDGNTSVGGNGSGGVIQNTFGDGISLTNTLSPSFTNMTIRGSIPELFLGSGIRGTQVTNFRFSNGTIDTVGHFQNPSSFRDESDIRLDDQAAGTERNVSGTVTITNNVLNNAPWHGIDIANFNGTISDLDISGNSLTSGTLGGACSGIDLAQGRLCSNGNAISVQAFGSTTATASITKATIANNVIANFPRGAGIQVQGGNSSATGPGGTVGTPGDAVNLVAITGNRIAGVAADPMNGGISIGVFGGNSGARSRGNFEISNNGTVANPLANIGFAVISVWNSGYSTTTATVNNNVTAASNVSASGGIAATNGIPSNDDATRFPPVTATSETPDLTVTMTGNTIGRTAGNGILAGGRGSLGSAKFGIRNNTVGAPLSGARPGIRVDAGDATIGGSGDDAVCLDIRSNTSAGSGGAQGIGLYKQGTTGTTNDFGIEGMAATATPGVEQYVDGLNPSGAGTVLLSATSGFSNCNTAP
jgi:hypothetical protein